MSELDFDNLRDKSFSGDEVISALQEAGVRPESSDDFLLVLNSIVSNREVKKDQDRWDNTVKTMAKCFERTKGSDSNIEGWHDDLLTNSDYLLLLASENRQALTELDKKSVEVAALTSVYLEIQTGGEPDGEVLQRAGVEPSWVVGVFNGAFREAYPKSPDEVDSLEDLTYRLNFDPMHWQSIVGSRFDELRPQLIESGFALPELGPDGMYEEERDEY